MNHVGRHVDGPEFIGEVRQELLRHGLRDEIRERRPHADERYGMGCMIEISLFRRTHLVRP